MKVGVACLLRVFDVSRFTSVSCSLCLMCYTCYDMHPVLHESCHVPCVTCVIPCTMCDVC